MTDYDSEHNITRTQESQDNSQRVDLTSFYSHLEYVHNALDSTNSPPPRSSDVASAFRMLANAFQVMRGESEGVAPAQALDDRFNSVASNIEVSSEAIRSGTVEEGRRGFQTLTDMIDQLMESADNPPDRPERVPDSFFDQLERVSKTEVQKLSREQNEQLACPICQVPFLQDKHPLIVRLPCSGKHLFDMECIQPWLMLNVTCPLDRKRLIASRPVTDRNKWEETLDFVYTDAQRREADSRILESEVLTEDVDDMYG